MVQPGKYEARISNYDIIENKKGEPQIVVLFDFKDADGNPREYKWFGNLGHPVGREIALKALVTLGFTGKNIADLAGGIVDGKALLDVSTPVEIDIQTRTHADKVYYEIKWINRLGGSKWVSGLTRDQARVKLGALNLEGELAAIRSQEGSRPRPQAVPKAAGAEKEFADYDDSEGLPF